MILLFQACLNEQLERKRERESENKTKKVCFLINNLKVKDKKKNVRRCKLLPETFSDNFE